MSRQRTAAITPDELLKLADELQSLALAFPQQPSAEVNAAAATLKEACQRFTAAIAPCSLLRLPEELLLRMLCALKSADLAALACCCHTLSDGALSSLIERGAHDALKLAYDAGLAVLPPKALRAHARLRWLERARVEAQSWLQAVKPYPGRETAIMWPKSEHTEEPPSASWIEAVARFAGQGRDLSIDVRRGYSSDRQGQYAEAGVRAALKCFALMAARSKRIARDDLSDGYDMQEHPFPVPAITKGALLWVADKVPNLGEEDLSVAQTIADQLLATYSAQTWDRWKTGGHESVVAAHNVKAKCEPLLHALLAAKVERHGPDSAVALTARVALGELLAAAARVSLSSPTQATILAWGEVPPSNADAVLTEAVASFRRSARLLTSELAVRALSAYAGCLSQQGLFVSAAELLRELLEAFVRRDGGYTKASWGNDDGLAYQIQAVARHTRKAGSETCMAGAALLRVHTTALRNFVQGPAEPHDLRNLYYEDDAKLLLSHCRRAEGGALLAEAEALARELVAHRKYKWDLKLYSKLLKVLIVRAALGTEGATSAVEECRATICAEVVAAINSVDQGNQHDRLFGSFEHVLRYSGYRADGSRDDKECRNSLLCGIKVGFLKQQGMIERIETMQRARLNDAIGTDASGTAVSVSREALMIHGRLAGLLIAQEKWEDSNSELCKLSASVSVSVDVTDRLADDLDHNLTMLGHRHTNSNQERILTLGCKEAVLQQRVAACQQQYTPDHPQAAKMQETLRRAAKDLAVLLLENERVGEAEAMAHLAVTTANAALAEARASVEQGPAVHSDIVGISLLDCVHSIELLVKVVRYDAEQNEHRVPELETALGQLITALTARIDHPDTSRINNSYLKEMLDSYVNRRFEVEFDLANLRRVQGDFAHAKLLADRLVNASSASPLVRARAMVFRADLHAHDAGLMPADSDEPMTLKVEHLAGAEPLLSRACMLFSGLLNAEVECTRSRPFQALEWDELYYALHKHASVLYRLDRREEADAATEKRWDIFGYSDQESEGEDEQGEDEQGEDEQRGEGVQGEDEAAAAVVANPS